MTKAGVEMRAGEGFAARAVALDALDAVLFQKKNLDEVLAGNAGFEKLVARDRAFARLLILTVLRRLGQIDALVSQSIDRKMEDIRPRALLDVLRLGAAQLVFLETPAHAAVHTSVELAAEKGMAHQKGFVNAVMRSMSEKAADVRAMPEKDAGRLNTPDWLWQEWVKDYGMETALEIAAANMKEAPVDITVKENPDLWAERLEAKVLPNGTLRRSAGGAVQEFSGFKDGAWWIQNLAASLPARLFGDAKGKTIVDLCAAPGGKTAQLLAQGAKVIAVDRSAQRMVRLHENMERLGLKDNLETVVADGAVWRPTRAVDGILIDAPCTATGTLRHQPDVARLKTPADQTKLMDTQERLLKNAVSMLSPGGILVYCTCSLQKAEGEEQIDALFEFLSQRRPLTLPLSPASGGEGSEGAQAPEPGEGGKKSSFSLWPIGLSEIDHIDSILTPRGEVRSLPFHFDSEGGIDGFYIARLLRT